ncbi:WD40-like Beta Propeller Repeat [Nitrosomonas marina]|uniref:WD40-like Beta Propeller Repeat n=1 Tax=Nitrosomonas marina TaxID=917 RepID=A0A1H9Y2Y7_9PROT|nr:biopolymer transporter Tol [Nitrosomonas marina]SES63154.1 WD40-like Beta Propeller Repeat [Nitrosomonas marina]
MRNRLYISNFFSGMFARVLLSVLITVMFGFANAGNTDFITEDFVLSDTEKEKRVGEAYYRADQKWMVYQAEVADENPFYQIYLKHLETGKIRQVSPGIGKTTCSWVHPSADKVLFSSTHEDPDARNKMTAELERRKSGERKSYAWDYDEHYDIYETDLEGNNIRNLTNVLGYDAEASWSPDGNYIAFASNRRAYTEKLTEAEAELFKKDPSSMIDIYIMDADGSNVKRLTHTNVYDGGPFFSTDGKRIVWRRFSPNGREAEVFTMNIDGTDQKQITHLKALSWAPFYHPSNEYIIFSTNIHGHRNFELYIVDVEGEKSPVRVTDKPGFDGLPVFTPDGNYLTWTSDRVPTKKGHLFHGKWNHEKAMQSLSLKRSE